jgi:hypothetical protein
MQKGPEKASLVPAFFRMSRKSVLGDNLTVVCPFQRWLCNFYMYIFASYVAFDDAA